MGDEALEVQQHGPPAGQRDVVHAEAGLQGRVLEQLVQHHGGHGVPLHLVHDADALAVALVADVADALDLLVVHQVGALLHQVRLVHHEGDLLHDDGLAATLVLLDAGLAAQHHAAAAGLVGLAHPVDAVDGAARGEVRRLDVLHQAGRVDVPVLDVGDGGVADLAQVVRGHVGGHAHRDARCAVHQQGRDARGHHRGLFQGVVEVGAQVHRLLVQVGEHLLGDLLQARLGVPHGGGAVPVDAAEVALAVHQRVAQAPVLGHAHHGVVHAAVPVRVVLPEHLTHDPGALLVRTVAEHAQLLHAEQHPPVHRLQTVAHVGQGPAHDHRHRIVDVGGAHLVLDVDRNDPLSCCFCHVCQIVTLARYLLYTCAKGPRRYA